MEIERESNSIDETVIELCTYVLTLPVLSGSECLCSI